MQLLKKVCLVVIILLSLSAGSVKVVQMPQEVQFFEAAGLGTTLLVVLGVVQVLAGLLLLFYKSRKLGAAIAAVSFLVSSAVIFMTGNIGFALFSLLPVLIASYFATKNVELHSAWR